MKFGIIVPTYNRAEKLQKCLQSIVNQEKTDDIQVIVINDGSTDNTDEVVEQYKKYLEIQYFKQVNLGVSAARNKGIKMLSNEVEYVLFLDSDDTIDEFAFQNIRKFYEFNSYNVSVLNMHIYTEEGKSSYKNEKYDYSHVNIKENYWLAHYFIGGTIIRKDIIDKYNFEFDTSINFFEDAIFVTKIILLSGEYGVIQNAIYNYNKNTLDDSLVNQTNNNGNRFSLIENKVYELLLNYANENKLRCDYLDYLIYHHLRVACSYKYLSVLSEKDLDKFVLSLNEFIKKMNIEVLYKLKVDDFRKKVLVFLITGDKSELEYKPRGVKYINNYFKFPFFNRIFEFDIKGTDYIDMEIFFVMNNKKYKSNEIINIEEKKTIYFKGFKITYPFYSRYKYKVGLKNLWRRNYKIIFNDKVIKKGLVKDIE